MSEPRIARRGIPRRRIGLRRIARPQIPRGGASVRLAAVTLVLLAAFALLTPLIIPHDSRIVDFAVAGHAPSWEHLFGTDSQGRDLFVRVAIALRLSIAIALVVALVASAAGVIIGVVAGYLGGAVDQFLMRFADTVNALPHLVLGLVIVAMFRGEVLAIVVAMVITHWVTIARIVRAQTLALRHSNLVASAWLSGMSRPRIIAIHLLPAVAGQAVISVLLTVPHIVWHESTFSFLGIGLPPHEPSLGTLLSDAQAGILLGQWWLLVFPAGALVLVTLAIGVLGQGFARRINGETL